MQDQTDKKENVIHPWAINASGEVIKNGIASMCPFQLKIISQQKMAFDKMKIEIQEFPCTCRCPHCNLSVGKIYETDKDEKPIITITCGGMPLQFNFVDLSNENKETKLVSM